MSKQSEAKEKQGYRKDAPCCQNCSLFSMKYEQVKSKYNSNYTYTKESEYRCTVGNFKVLKRGWCKEYKSL